MFCGNTPCECAGKKSSKLKRKPLPKSDAPVEKERKAKPKPEPSRPAPSLKRTGSVDDELAQVLRVFDYFDMLHPDEQKKYEQHLHVPETTGKLVANELAQQAGEETDNPEDQGGGV